MYYIAITQTDKSTEQLHCHLDLSNNMQAGIIYQKIQKTLLTVDDNVN